jgi:hypothetical protein
MDEERRHKVDDSFAELEPPKQAGRLARAKMPVWLALLLMLVVGMFAFFVGYPERSVSNALQRTFRGTDQVKITYCLSNEAARDPDRWRAEQKLREELESLGVQNVEISFVSPCPSRMSPGPQASPDSRTGTPASQ